MLWEILSESEKNKIFLKLLVHVSMIDGKLKPEEFAYLVTICRKLHLDPELIRDYVHLRDEEIREILPIEEEDRMRILYHALFIMNADKEVDFNEEVFIYKLAFKLGFSEEMTKDFIGLMKHYSLDDLPRDAMIDIIRKFNN